MCKASALHFHGRCEQSRIAFAQAVVSHCCLAARYPEAQDLLAFVFEGVSASGAQKELRHAILSEQAQVVRELHKLHIVDKEYLVYIRCMRIISAILSPFNSELKLRQYIN